MAEFKINDFTTKLRKFVKLLIREIVLDITFDDELSLNIGCISAHKHEVQQAHGRAMRNRFLALYEKFTLNIPLTDKEREWLYKELYFRFEREVDLFALRLLDKSSSSNIEHDISYITSYRDLVISLGITYEKYGDKEKANKLLTTKEIADIWNNVCDENEHPEDRVNTDDVKNHPCDPVLYLHELLTEAAKLR